MSLEDFVLRIIGDHEKITKEDILEFCETSQGVINMTLYRLRKKGLIKSSMTKPAFYFLSEKGKKYYEDMLNRTFEFMSLSEKEILEKKEIIKEEFKREIRSQIILDNDLLEIFTVLPFCRGRCGRNRLGITAQFIGDCGRGKDMLHEIYKDIMDSKKVDCRDFFVDGKANLKELKSIVESYPDILFVDEIGVLFNSPRRAYQKYLDNKDFPIVFMGNPETEKIDIEMCSSFEEIIEHTSKSGKSISDRVNLWIYFPPLTLEEKKELPKIIFNKKDTNLGIISSYVQYAFRNYDPTWTTEAQEYFNLILENAEKLLNGERKTYYPGKKKKETPERYILRGKRGNLSEKWINLHSHIEGARFMISIMSIARGLAMRDLRNEILGRDVLKAIELKFDFLKKLYGSDYLIRDLTFGIENKKILEVHV